MDKGVPRYSSVYEDYLRGLADGYYNIEIWKEQKVNFETIQMMRYYRGVIIKMICEFMNGEDCPAYLYEQTHKEIADLMLRKGREVLGKDGQVERLYNTPSTAKFQMDTREFSKYIDNVRMWAGSFLGLNTPDAKP